MIIYSIPWDMRKLQMFRQHKSILKFWMFWAINQIRGSETHFLFLILHLLVPYLSFQSSNLLFYFPYNISKSCSILSSLSLRQIGYTALFGKVYRIKRYFKVRDDNLSAKQGSLCTFKMILIRITRKYFMYIFTYIYICYKVNT